MKNRKKVNIPLRIAGILLCFVVFVLFFSSGMLARYSTGAGAPDIAGGLYEKECDNQPIITAILNEFDSVYSGLPKTDFIGYYREKSYLSGRSVTVDGTVYESARICDDFSLLVEGKNGKRYLKNGEVSVIPM